MRWPSFACQREQAHDLRLAALEERRAVRARSDADLTGHVADVLHGGRRAALVDGDLLPHEPLVDRLGGPLHELLRQRVLDHRAVAVHRGRPDRERQLDGLDDAVEEELAFRRLQRLRILLGFGQCAQVVLELLADVLLDDLLACPRGSCPATLEPGSGEGCPLPRSPCSARVRARPSSSTAPAASRRPSAAIRSRIRPTCCDSSSAVSSGRGTWACRPDG